MYRIHTRTLVRGNTWTWTYLWVFRMYHVAHWLRGSMTQRDACIGYVYHNVLQFNIIMYHNVLRVIGGISAHLDECAVSWLLGRSVIHVSRMYLRCILDAHNVSFICIASHYTCIASHYRLLESWRNLTLPCWTVTHAILCIDVLHILHTPPFQNWTLMIHVKVWGFAIK